MATNYSRGRAFEYRTRDDLMHKQGATYVMRAAGSHTLADLTVFFPAQDCNDLCAEYRPCVWLVQCKRDGRLPAEERELLIDLANEVGAAAVLAKAGPGGRGVEYDHLNKEA